MFGLKKVLFVLNNLNKGIISYDKISSSRAYTMDTAVYDNFL